MGRWGQGIFENDNACDTLLQILDFLVLDLELQFEIEENSTWAYPESSLATAFVLLNTTSATSSANFCTCDAKLWRQRTEANLRAFAVKHGNGEPDLSRPSTQSALKLFDDLHSRAVDQHGECDCGGKWQALFLAAKDFNPKG